MKKTLLLGLFGAAFVLKAMAQSEIVNEASQLSEKGQFKEARALLTKAIDSKKYSADALKEFEFERERLDWIQHDFTLSKDALFKQVKAAVKDVTREEFEQWDQEGALDGRVIDGTKYYFSSAVANLFFRHRELEPRRTQPKKAAERAQIALDNVTSITKAAKEEHSPYVLPKKFHVTMTVTADADAVPAGETVRAWIPIPRRYPFQTDFKLLSTSSPVKNLADENSPIRSVYFEKPAEKDKPTEFKIEYEFTMRGVHFELDPAKIKPYDRNDPMFKKFTSEAPHVVFTPAIKALSAKIVGDETNPMLKAKKIFDWAGDNLLYSYAFEYSTIRNISEFCRSKGYGDCGQQALLFITLCRYNGIPARWQTGWNMTPGFSSPHDWAEIYLEPYGWIPVDPYMSSYAMQYITTLSPDQKRQIRDFYFGGLDQYRMIANSDHTQPLDPPKPSPRSDSVDFQRGELEHAGKNIYFNDFSHRFRFEEITTPQ